MIDVWCQSNCDKVELLLNGVSLGLKEVPRYGHVEWKVSYAPGHLDARGYKNGQVIIQDRVETTGSAAQLVLAPDRKIISADGKDVTVIAVSVRDDHGRLVPAADNEVHFKVTGPGRILGVGNGDPSSHEPDKANKRRAFNGLCLLLVQSTGKRGTVQVTAESAGLQPTTVKIQMSPVPGVQAQ
jgi:beta-galactosidase